MNDKNIIQAFNHLQNSEHLQTIQQALIKVMRNFNQDYQSFHQSLCHYFILELKGEFGNNIGVIRSRTGFTKTMVKNTLNDKSKLTTNFVERQKSLLAATFAEINSYCFNNNVERMPAIEFQKAMFGYADGEISLFTRMGRIMETGLIGEDKRGLYLVFDKPVKKITNDEYLELISDGFNYLVSTVIYNKNKPEHLSKLFQRQVLSSQISPKKSVDILNKTNEILAVAQEQVVDLFTKNEEDVPKGTYPEIVVQLLHYNQNLIEEYNHEKT